MKIFTVTLNGKDYEVQQGDDGVFSLPKSLEHIVGVGTQLKPAIEPIILAQKPLDGTVANNVLAHGVGGLNIDACRVEHDKQSADWVAKWSGHKGHPGGMFGGAIGTQFGGSPAGRFPANVLLDEHAAKEMDEQSGITKDGFHVAQNRDHDTKMGGYDGGWKKDTRDVGYSGEGGASRFFPVFKSEEETPETKGRFPANVLLDEHAAKEMDKQSGVLDPGGQSQKASDRIPDSSSYVIKRVAGTPRYQDRGGASRFFPVFKYQAKAPKKERPVIEREDGTKIQHATVKPLALMEWLVSLIVPPGGVVLDPFAGSGTTLQAALNKGFTPIGIEQDADYIKLIEKRLEGLCTTHKN